MLATFLVQLMQGISNFLYFLVSVETLAPFLTTGIFIFVNELHASIVCAIIILQTVALVFVLCLRVKFLLIPSDFYRRRLT